MRFDKPAFMHYRVYNQKYKTFHPTGGVTVYFEPYERVGTLVKSIKIRIARCSMKDHYNKATGRTLAKNESLLKTVMEPTVNNLDEFVIEQWLKVHGNEGQILMRRRGKVNKFVGLWT